MTRTEPRTPSEERLFTGFSGRMFLLLTVGSVFATFGRRVLAPLLPVIIDDLSITAFQAGIALSICTGFFAVCQYPSGRFADQLTRKTVLVLSLLALLIGSAVIAGTIAFPLFVLGAAFIGISEGLFEPASRALLSDLFQRRRGQAFGLLNTSIDIAGMLAAAIAIGAIAIATWRGPFVLLVIGGFVLVVLFVRWGRETIQFARVSLGVRETTVRLFTIAQFRRILISYALFHFTVQGVLTFFPAFLHTDKGFSVAFASLLWGAMFAVGIVVKPIAGQLSDIVPRVHIGSAALLFGAVGIAMFVLSSSRLVVIIGVVLFGAGGKSFIPVIQAHLMDVFADASRGGDFGATRTIVLVFASLGPAYVGYVASSLSYTTAFIGLIGCVVIAGVIFLVIALRNPRDSVNVLEHP